MMMLLLRIINKELGMISSRSTSQSMILVMHWSSIIERGTHTTITPRNLTKPLLFIFAVVDNNELCFLPPFRKDNSDGLGPIRSGPNAFVEK